MAMIWILNQGDPEVLGFIPSFLSENDPRPAKEQIDTNYQHGGGWRSANGFKLSEDNVLTYTGDPPMQPVAFTTLRDELLMLYPFSWFVIKQKDGSFEIARLD